MTEPPVFRARGARVRSRGPQRNGRPGGAGRWAWAHAGTSRRTVRLGRHRVTPLPRIEQARPRDARTVPLPPRRGPRRRVKTCAGVCVTWCRASTPHRTRGFRTAATAVRESTIRGPPGCARRPVPRNDWSECTTGPLVHSAHFRPTTFDRLVPASAACQSRGWLRAVRGLLIRHNTDSTRRQIPRRGRPSVPAPQLARSCPPRGAGDHQEAMPCRADRSTSSRAIAARS